MGFTKLDSRIIDSSIWEESADVLKLFITFWAKSNSEGEVNATYSSLLRTSNLHPESFQQSLDILMSVDKSSKSQTEDGKRIIRTGESNWLIVNYKKYRERTYSDNPESVRKREHRKYKDGYVYFAVSKDRVKIGYSLNPWSRVQELRIACPDLSIIKTIKATIETEKMFHDKFKRYLIEREWFKIEGDLKDFIESNYDLTTMDISQTVLGHSASISASDSGKEEECEKEKNNPVKELFDYWNLKSPIKHKEMGKAMESCLKRMIDEYPVPTIKEIISNYASVVTNAGSWYTYRSRLEEFFRAGKQKPAPYVKFLPESFTFTNFVRGNAQEATQSTIPPRDVPKYPNHTTLMMTVQDEFPGKWNYEHFPMEADEEAWRKLFDRICRIPRSERPEVVKSVMAELEAA